MTALIYGLNDCDETVRRKAADEIGDQLRENPCCCDSCVVNALTAALRDCDRRVRREAAQALRVCGYVVTDQPCYETMTCGALVGDYCDSCCDSCCDAFCDNGDAWLQAPVDDFTESEDPPMSQEYNPAPIEDDPFVPPAPVNPDEVELQGEGQAEPAIFFPPTAASFAQPIGTRNSVQPTSWVR